MGVTFRAYACPAGISENYFRLRAFFLRRLGDDFPFGRWDWMITHDWLDGEAVGRIGIREDEGDTTPTTVLHALVVRAAVRKRIAKMEGYFKR